MAPSCTSHEYCTNQPESVLYIARHDAEDPVQSHKPYKKKSVEENYEFLLKNKQQGRLDFPGN